MLQGHIGIVAALELDVDQMTFSGCAQEVDAQDSDAGEFDFWQRVTAS